MLRNETLSILRRFQLHLVNLSSNFYFLIKAKEDSGTVSSFIQIAEKLNRVAKSSHSLRAVKPNVTLYLFQKSNNIIVASLLIVFFRYNEYQFSEADVGSASA